MPTLWHAVRSEASRRPHAAAITQGSATTSYGSLVRHADAFATVLRDAGVRPGDRVMTWMEPSAAHAAAILGAWGMGALVVPIAPETGRVPLTHIVASARPAVVVHGDRALDGFDGVPRVAAHAVSEGASLPPAGPLPADDASIVFTSGSTGRPKGVVQTHGSLADGAARVAGYQGLTAADRLLCPVPWSFDYGYLNLQLAWRTGAELLLPATAGPFGTADALRARPPTVVAGTPSLFALLVGALQGVDARSVRAVTSTGSRFAPTLLRQTMDRFPEARWFLNYGLTESYRTACATADDVLAAPTCIGRPIPGVDVLIVDDGGRVAAPGEVGHLVHRGAGLLRAYWEDAASTQAALRPDPTDPGAPRVLFTGDLGVRDADGRLHLVGRADRQFKSMGSRVCPEEVEAVLRDCPAVAQVAVVDAPHPVAGRVVCAAVVPAAGATEPAAAIRAFARAALSPALVPQRLILCAALPGTVSGKVDLAGVRALFGAEETP